MLRSSAPVFLTLLLGASCGMNPTLPDGAVVLCASDAERECPSGLVCDLASHTCIDPSASPDLIAPALTSARFDPRFARDGVVTLTISADETHGVPPVPKWSGDRDPGFTFVDISGGDARFETTIALDAPDDMFTLASVSLEDERGNVAERPAPPDAVLIIDHVAPTVLSLRAVHADDPLSTLPFSPNPGTNQIAVTFLVDEDVAPDGITVTLGDCAVEAVAPTSYLITFDQAGCTTNGEADISVRAADRAGNATSTSVRVRTDNAAPAATAVTTLTLPPSTASIGALLAGAHVTINIVPNEALAAAPLVAFDETQVQLDPPSISIVPLFDGSFVYEANVLEVGAGPLAAFSAELVDQVGNRSVVELGALPLSAAVTSPCAPTSGCVDFDGDGHGALQVGCVSASDCNDLDPFVHRDALEIPGDGQDNDCAGDGDLEIGEAVGVFVDPQALPDGPGTIASPTTTIEAGQALLGDRQWLFLRRDENYSFTGDLRAHLLGNLDTNWERVEEADRPNISDPSRTNVVLDGTLFGLDAVQVIDGVSVQCIDPVIAEATLFSRGGYYNCDVTMENVFVSRSAAFESVTLRGLAGAALMSNTVLDNNVSVESGRSLTVIGALPSDFVGGNAITVDVLSGGRATVVNSVIGSARCQNCNGLTIAHSILFGQVGAPATLVVDLPTGLVDVVDTIFTFAGVPGPAPYMTGDGIGSLSLESNLFDDSFGPVPLFASPSFNAVDLATLDDCEPTCARSDNNHVATSGIGPDRNHLTPLSPALGIGIRADGVIDAVLADIDGTCRADLPSVSIGPDEP